MKSSLRYLVEQYGLVATLAALSLCGLAGCNSDVNQPEGGDGCAEECGEGKTCIADKCYDTDKVCGFAVCGEQETCIANACVENAKLCGGKQCGGDEKCDEGKCVSKPSGEEPASDKLCGGAKCGANEVCTNNVCVVKDPCAGVNCVDGQSCAGGACVDKDCIEDGAVKNCGEGRMCKAGECIDDGCGEIECGEGMTCVAGDCEETACIGVFCGESKTCRKGECIDNNCLDVSCEDGTKCRDSKCIPDVCLNVQCELDKVCLNDGSCAYDSDPAFVVVVPVDNKTDEDGKTVNLFVALNHQPSKEVKVTCEVSDDTEGAAECNLIFNADNWNIPQSVVVTGVYDVAMDGDQAYSVNFKSSSDDAAFHELTAEAALVNVDTTLNGVVVTAPDSPMVSEAGTSLVLEVVLSAQPDADVTISVSSSDTSEGRVDVESLTFTPDNWDSPQQITVTGVDDKEADGSQAFNVEFGASVSEDERFNGLVTEPVAIMNQDDDSAGATFSSGRIKTDEVHLTSKVSVVLNTQPHADVTLTFAIDHPEEASVDHETIVFTPEDWNVKQTLVFSGVADYVIDPDVDFEVTVSFASDDDKYNGLPEVKLHGTNYNTDMIGLSVQATGTPYVTEAGSTADYKIALNSRPSTEVKLLALALDPSELEVVSGANMIFSSDDWNIPQILTVKGVDDNDIDGDQRTSIAFTATSDDKDYKRLSTYVSFITTDDDDARIVVEGEPAVLKEEAAETATFTVKLSSKPTANVTVSLMSSDLSELEVASSKTLTFTASNWNTPQTVTVRSVDDKLADSSQFAKITLTADSGDAHWKAATASSPIYTIVDNESASVVISPNYLELKPEPGLSEGTFSVSLGSKPAADVKVSLVSSDSKTIALSKTELVFTTDNWNNAQVVTVSSKEFSSSIAMAKITSTTSCTNDAYNGLSGKDVDVKVYAITTKEFAPQNSCQEVVLYKGSYKLQVWGASGGDEVGFDQTVGSHAGLGGYAEGILTLPETTKCYVCVGGQGTLASKTPGIQGGGFNGGGNGCTSSGGAHGFGGGGATDIRIGSSSLYARVIVAGGGGGTDDGTSSTRGTIGSTNDGSGGAGGGLSGGGGTGNGIKYASLNGGTQTTGAAFGEGGVCQYSVDFGGGGGGWFGGLSHQGSNNINCGAGGGSGFVYTESSNVSSNVIGGTWLLNSTYYLKNTVLLDGTQSFIAPSGNNNETGHPGNGFARISVVE